MTLTEFFHELEIDGSVVLARFQGNQALLLYFLRKFPKDPQYQQVLEAEEEGDLAKLEISAHTLKGITANLGLNKMFAICSEIVSDIRADNREEAISKVNDLTGEYQRTVACIEQLEG